MKKREKIVVGRNEPVALPALGITRLEAKVDTGAYGTSIHCDKIQVIDEGKSVRFRVLDPDHPEYKKSLFTFPVHREKWVKSSNGQKELRVTIKTDLYLAGRKIPTEIALTDRSAMRYPMLLGRTLLTGRFVVDVEKENITEPHPAETRKDPA